MCSPAACRCRSASRRDRGDHPEGARPQGVGVICEARHFCMMMRGVEKQHSGTVTSAMLGGFRERKETRDEFLSLISQSASRF